MCSVGRVFIGSGFYFCAAVRCFFVVGFVLEMWNIISHIMWSVWGWVLVLLWGPPRF